MHVRILGEADRSELEAFTAAAPELTMFFRSNLALGGLVDRGARFEGTYAAAFEDDRMVGLAAHYWHDGLIVYAPRGATEVARAAQAACGRHVYSIVGPYGQVLEVTDALGLGPDHMIKDSREILYALALSALIAPPSPARVRRATAADLPVLLPWRASYDAEMMGLVEADVATPAWREKQRSRLEMSLATNDLFVLEEGGRTVSMCSFNAKTPDCVQIGGVFTPPPLRSRGYGRTVVAHALAIAQREGVERSVLFTGDTNHPAQRAYEALGYRPIGDYGIRRFRLA